jgi:acyl carrier protein
MSKDELKTFIVSWLSEQLGRAVNQDASLAALGLDSLDAVRLADALAEKLGVDELPVSVVLDQPSVVALVDTLAATYVK